MAIHPCTQYALDAVEGRLVVGHSEWLACKRHLDDLERQGTEAFPWVFDEALANRVYKFFHYCHHIEGEFQGQPIELQPFQQFDIGCVFGWVHKDSGERRFKIAYEQEARKNAKSTKEAAICNYLMVGDGEMSPRVFTAAVDREQAKIVFEIAKAMAENSPDIAKRLKITKNKIIHKKCGGVLMPLSKETKNKDGLHPSGAVIDEYHAHTTGAIYNLLRSARGGFRKQYLIMIITTAGYDTESPCHAEYEYCKLILANPSLNERYFVMIRELDEGDDIHDPKNWIKANPLRMLLPRSRQDLQDEHDEAFGSGDAEKIREFRVKNLNQWVHGDEMSFMGELMEKWDSLGVTPEKFAELTRGRLCLVGADLAKRIDLTADAFILWLPDGRLAVSAHGFMPDETVKKHERTDRVPYLDWSIAKRWITTTDGGVTDYRVVEEHIQKRLQENDWKVHQLCYDPYNATQFATQMTDKGFISVDIRQVMQVLSEPTKLFRDLVASGMLVHDGSPALRWCVANAKEIVDTNENVKVVKKNKGDTHRIDLLVAIITAMRQLQALKDAQSLIDEVKSGDFGF